MVFTLLKKIKSSVNTNDMEENFTHANLTYLRSMSAGSNELIKEMIEIFLTQVPGFIEDMNQHLENKEYEKLGALAHKAKSSVTVMGMDELGKDLKTLELLAKKGEEPEKYPGLLTSTLGHPKLNS